MKTKTQQEMKEEYRVDVARECGEVTPTPPRTTEQPGAVKADCSDAEWSARFNALPESIRTIGVAMELRTRIQQLAMEKRRLKAHYQRAVSEVEEHMKNCELYLAELSLPKATRANGVILADGKQEAGK